jgi:hypothetical protein
VYRCALYSPTWFVPTLLGGIFDLHLFSETAAPIRSGVIDTLAVADTQPPIGQLEGPSQGATEGPPQESDADHKAARHFWFRVAAAGVLLLLAIGLGLWALAPRAPDSFAAKASLVGAAAVAFGAGAVCLPLGLRHRLGTFAIVAGTFAGLLATVLAIPDRSPVPLASGESSRLPSESPSPIGSQNGPEPLTATFNFNLPMCEDFIVPTSQVDSLPGKSQINAQWAYENGGATLGGAELTVQARRRMQSCFEVSD